jgi:hypothetical protein
VPITTLFIVPWPCAGTSAAWASASSTVSAIRWLVSTLPAHTADGARASTRQPSGTRIVTASYNPAFTGTSAPSATLTANVQAARVTARGAFTFPTAGGEVPARSISIACPAIVTATRIGRSSSVTPSPSISLAAR